MHGIGYARDRICSPSHAALGRTCDVRVSKALFSIHTVTEDVKIKGYDQRALCELVLLCLL